jgi:DNA-binding CsgD family transcriptional regulator/PAS domain-containing protein
MPKAITTNRVIEQAYDCVVEEDGWDELLASYARLVGADSGLMYLVPRLDIAGRTIASVNYDLSSSGLKKYLAYYEARSPTHPIYRKLPEADVRPVGAFAFSPDFRETEFYQDWARPQGYADMLGSHLVHTPQLHAWLCLRRAEDRGAYTRPEILAARHVAPHLSRAIKLRARFEQEMSAVGCLRETLEALSFGVLILNADAKVIMANRTADSIVRAGDGLRCNHGRLACARTQETSVLHHAIRNLASAGTVMDLYVSRSDGRRPLTVHIMPIASLTAWRGFAPPAAVAAAFVIDPLNCTATVDGFAAAYGLTASESRVLREIISCEGLVQAARKLRIAVPTAKTHLQHIFSKTSTSSQVELVQLLMRSSLQTKRPVE